MVKQNPSYTKWIATKSISLGSSAVWIGIPLFFTEVEFEYNSGNTKRDIASNSSSIFYLWTWIFFGVLKRGRHRVLFLNNIIIRWVFFRNLFLQKLLVIQDCFWTK